MAYEGNEVKYKKNLKEWLIIHTITYFIYNVNFHTMKEKAD